MKNTENKVFNETEKTVIFLHTAVQYVMDKTITEQATYIKKAKEELNGSEESIFYYLNKMREAAKSDKKYLIIEYEPVIGGTIEALMKAPKQYNFCQWSFYTFFHADICPDGVEPNHKYNANDEKMEILAEFYGYPFILKYTIPVGYILTVSDIEKIKSEFTGPQTVKELRRLFWNVRKGIKPKKHFSFYEPDLEKLKDYIDRRKL